jgi:hypothetical protein
MISLLLGPWWWEWIGDALFVQPLGIEREGKPLSFLL